METTDLKNIWKSETDKNIKPYSEKELRDITVKATRKALRRIYPNYWASVIPVFSALFLIWKIATFNQPIPITIINITALTIFIALFLTRIYSKWKMNSDKKHTTTKEWLKFRLDAMGKSYRRKTKYAALIYGGGFIVALAISWLNFYFNNISNVFVWIGAVIFLIPYIIVLRREEKKRYKKVIETLRNLNKQFEEED